MTLAFGAASARLESGGALAGGLLQAISHATAKAAMFMSAARAAELRRTEWMVFCIDRAWQDYGTASRNRCTSVPHGLSRFGRKTAQVTAHSPARGSALIEIGEAVRAGVTPLACVSCDTSCFARAITLVVFTSGGRSNRHNCQG